MSSSYLYGLEHATHNFTKAKSFGKNIFTNAFPVSLAMYLSESKGLDPGWVSAVVDKRGGLGVHHSTRPLKDIVGTDPKDIFWAFEESFDEYDRYATGQVNHSDIVVKNRHTGEETSAFEVKLTVVPTSGTANKARANQSCELVVRPPSIEQLCFSIAAGYGPERRHDIGDIIAKHLTCPMDYDWDNESYMLQKLPFVVAAAEDIARTNIENQRPFMLDAVWRTIGKSPTLDEEAFDVFFWTDMAFLQFFTRAAHAQVTSQDARIGRPARSVIWLIKSLWDYSTQGKVTFERTHSLITFGGQTDKAGAFTGNVSLSLVKCDNFVHPRIKRDEYPNIIAAPGIHLLSPERRLDGVLSSDYQYYFVSLE